GSVVHVATDDADYLRHMRHVIGKLRFYTEDEEQASLKDLAGLRTDFEQRWLAQGRHVPHLAYIFQRSALRQSRNRHLRESG
ncbi:MAG: hypothetical protein K9N51_07660, partial [Candidatus Pacebacteria bacterium]|nr:hypothetical protein [Candidatus Paceibacterota bacterium]